MFQQQNKARLLCIYAESQTYTSTVFEHLSSFKKYSKYDWYYCDFAKIKGISPKFNWFDGIVIHYSVRLPFGQIDTFAQQSLQKYKGIKILFIQDEYDYANATQQILQRVAFDLVFTVVPEKSIQRIYPLNKFPKTKFISNLTGYVPDDLVTKFTLPIPPSKRDLTIAYRGRKLPIRYGKLAQEKYLIGEKVKKYCAKNSISCDIEWNEGSRIYGKFWYRFILSAKAMLGTESGSNVFDWNNSIENNISDFLRKHPQASEQTIYKKIVQKYESPGLMNQVSPRIFEMAAGHTIMVLFEGSYSGVLEPDVHYLPLKKNFKNLEAIFKKLSKVNVDQLAERAYVHLVESGKYSYRTFVSMVDGQIDQLARAQIQQATQFAINISGLNSDITEFPKRSRWGASWKNFLWLFFPPTVHSFVKYALKHPAAQTLLNRK